MSVLRDHEWRSKAGRRWRPGHGDRCDICGGTPDSHPVGERMGERARAVTLATWVLDDTSRDPDSDTAILARQFLRCIDATVARSGQEARAST